MYHTGFLWRLNEISKRTYLEKSWLCGSNGERLSFLCEVGATVKGRTVKRGECPPHTHTLAHLHTCRMLKTPSVSWCNHTARFRAILWNTAQVWKSLDIRRCMTAPFLIGGYKVAWELRNLKSLCVGQSGCGEQSIQTADICTILLVQTPKVPMLSWKFWLCNCINIGSGLKLFSESFTNLQEVPSLFIYIWHCYF